MLNTATTSTGLGPWPMKQIMSCILDGRRLRSEMLLHSATRGLRDALVVGAMALLGGCHAPERGAAEGGAILPDAAFLTLLEYVQATRHVDVQPVFVLYDRMMADGWLRASLDNPEIYVESYPSLELTARLSELGVETCRVTEQIICPEAHDASTAMVLIVADGATDTEMLFRPTLFTVRLGEGGYSADGFEFEVSRARGEWSVRDMRRVFSEN